MTNEERRKEIRDKLQAFGRLQEHDARWLLEQLDLANKRCDILREALTTIQTEIDRGKSKDCIGCCNGNDIPDETLCRACWRIWIGDSGYLLWDWQTTEKRIAAALKAADEVR